ncbi:MAG: metallophosphoesterase family protein [Terriglobales bacterium]
MKTMRVAALYDIHGNLPALEAVLAEIRDMGVDQIIVGGDVLPGPMPRETLDLLLGLDIPAQFIYGNGEIAVLESMAGHTPAKVPEAYRPIITWNAGQLTAEHQRALANWPPTVHCTLDGVGDVLFCHATPQNPDDIFLATTAEGPLLRLFAEVNVDLVVCGHTHMQFDRRIANTRVVNAGSVGMPFGRPGADWLLLGSEVQLRHTSYDLSAAAERIRATAYPEAENFASKYVLQPPSETQMLELFARAELK